jgi:hypothetical protein
MAKTRRASTIDLAEFTETVTASLLRASQARKRRFGPILVGIIWWPEGMDPNQLPGPFDVVRGRTASRSRRK